jgi:DNA-binding NtrC family response regulator
VTGISTTLASLGSNLYLYKPLNKRTNTRKKELAVFGSKKYRILVVDDEIDLRKLLTDVLVRQGYDITGAADGEEAIASLAHHSYDIALLDIQMPKVNGIQVLKYIQKHCTQTKAIMLTGYADLKHAMEAKEFGARDFIDKPYKVEDVLDTIKTVLKE